ncbi:MAG: TonB-dependent receptor [Robiginitomaculum sp.]|nr:TonB-dependent receptor [Robiginitomaculum sp.]
MRTTTLKTQLALSVSALMLVGNVSIASFAQEGANVADEIISTGTRRKARSAADTPAPVDVISGAEFVNNASSDIGDLLRTVVPSFNVNAQPISDAATIIRPANLRGLSPDNTLVLLNGKRRHRGSVIAFLGGGISDGAQGVDIGVMPALGLKQVEVLRDGASSQYGSDAIAGVMNFVLKDASEGFTVEAKYGSTYAGDGDNYRISGNIGLPLGENGFVNITGEYGESDGTFRAVQRGDAAALIAAGNTAVGDISVNTQTTDFVQYWGQPDVRNDYKVFVNSGIELTENAEVYAFGNYAERTVEGGFFFRNPTNRGGVFRGPQVNPLTGNALLTVTNDNGTPGILTDDFDELFDEQTNVLVTNPSASVRVGTLAGGAAACPRGIPLTSGGGLIPDPTILATVTGDPNWFSFLERFPGGFVPRCGGDNRDMAITGGVRGELDVGTGLGYDLSASYGTNKTTFFISNTINASLGPNTPTSFTPGAYEQIETSVNLDLNYGVPISGWASDLGVAAGFEWHDEQFDITAGDPASFALGPLAAPFDPLDPNNQNGVAGFPTGQGFSSSSNGFGGFANSSSNSQSNIALYGELEADVTDSFTFQAALRWEDYDLFGTTTNWKVGGLYKLTDSIRLRGTYSTGFHAPSAGQANVVNTTTAFNTAGELADQGTIPLNTAPGQLAADFLENAPGQPGIRPTLGPETADNLSVGIAFDTGPMSWTVDYFNISVKDRIALTDNFDFQEVLDFTGTGLATYDGSSIGAALTTLDAAGRLNRADFTGFEDLRFFRFFTNNFDTKTTGFDIVGRMPFDVGVGSSSVSIAANYTNTTVKNQGKIVPLQGNRIQSLEELLPNWKGNVMFNHEQGIWRGLARINYYGPWTDTGNGNVNVGGEFLVDLELGAKVMDNVEVIVGAANVFDNYPDENPGQLGIGQLYPEASPFGFNGGAYYLKLRITG